MKMKVTLLLLASVFFVSCGMPKIFSPNTSEYSLRTVTNPSDDTVEGMLDMHLDPTGPNYSLLGDADTMGPSLMFFYTFDSGSDATYLLTSGDLSSFTTKFKTEFNKNGYEGKPVSNPSELVSIEKTNGKAYLYGVNTSTGSKFNARDRYVLYAQNQGNLAALDSFTLTQTPDVGDPTNRYTLDLLWTKATSSPAFISNALKLYDFNGQAFSKKRSDIEEKKINNTNNHEYEYIESSPTKVNLHLYAAFFISGPFSNYFWSDLVYLGFIPIDLV